MNCFPTLINLQTKTWSKSWTFWHTALEVRTPTRVFFFFRRLFDLGIADLLTTELNSLVSFDLDTLRASLDLIQHFQRQAARLDDPKMSGASKQNTGQTIQRVCPGGAQFLCVLFHQSYNY